MQPTIWSASASNLERYTLDENNHKLKIKNDHFNKIQIKKVRFKLSAFINVA